MAWELHRPAGPGSAVGPWSGIAGLQPVGCKTAALSEQGSSGSVLADFGDKGCRQLKIKGDWNTPNMLTEKAADKLTSILQPSLNYQYYCHRLVIVTNQFLQYCSHL